MSQKSYILFGALLVATSSAPKRM